MLRYGLPVAIEWSEETLIFYSVVIFSVYFFANFLKDVSLKVGTKTWSIPCTIIVPSLILIFVKGFAACGRDLVAGYYVNFMTSEAFETTMDQTLELGYRLLNLFIKKFFDEYSVFLFIISLLTILPIAYVANKYKSKINVGLMFFLYATIFFFPGFSLLRIYLASSFGLLFFVELFEKRFGKALFWMVIATLIHASTISFFVFFVILVFFKRFDRKTIFSILIVLFAIIFFLKDLWVSLLSGRYEGYTILENIELGFEQIIYYVPLFIFLNYANKNNNDEYIFRLSSIYLFCGFFFGMLGYVLPIAGRIQSLYIGIVLILAYFQKKCENKNVFFSKFLTVLIMFYGYMRFYIYIFQYYNSDDIMPYVNVFGWICN